MAKEFDIKIDRSLLNMDKDVKKAYAKALVEMGDLTQNEIKKTRKFKDRTGDLRRKILRDKVNAQQLSVEVISTVGGTGRDDPPYGNFLNDGTRFIKAMRFMEDGLKKASNRFERILVRAMDRFL